MIVTNTMIAIYSCIAVLTVVAAYIYGYSRAYRKGEGEAIHLRGIAEQQKQLINYWIDKFGVEVKAKVEWFSKYTALQQEIECTLHESHEEVERPHVEQIWPVDRNVTSDWKEFGYKPQHQDLVFEDEDEEQFLDSIYKKQDKDIDHRVPGIGC